MATRLSKSPYRCTVPFFEFRSNYHELFLFIATISEHANIIDRNRKVAVEALASGGTKTDLDNWERVKLEKTGPANSALKSTLDLQRKIVFVQAVDYFLVYISELLKILHRSHPAMLKTDEKITYSEITEFSRMIDLVDYMIDKKVQDLSFKSLSQLSKEVKNKHGFDLFRSPLSLQLASMHVEKRNILVHNNGIVNRRYIERTGSRLPEGSKIPLARIFDAIVHLEMLGKSIDCRAREKFKIKRSWLTESQEP